MIRRSKLQEAIAPSLRIKLEVKQTSYIVHHDGPPWGRRQTNPFHPRHTSVRVRTETDTGNAMVDSESDNDIWNEIYKSLQGSPEGATQSVQPPLLPQDEVPAFGTIDATTSSAAPPPLPDTPALECPKCHGALVISDGFGCGRGHVTMLSHAHGFADFCGTERRSCCQCKKYILSARRLNRLCNFGLEGFLLWRSAREPVDRVTVSPYVAAHQSSPFSFSNVADSQRCHISSAVYSRPNCGRALCARC